MKTESWRRFALIVATLALLAWTALNTVFWPIEDYADAALAYAESTNQIVRGMSIGIVAYVSCLAIVFGWGYSNKADTSLN